ncbi:hypothetical protein [Cellulomonas sp. PS-H5]|uniref:hypothetical protein n=1 Tax=Cellulomonas sp. PS-H5 TaxID=2820400 RepID=UPI001C4F50CD|nr:hypothetical protein [Cellulomonas sp. PS-H5]MBW0253746.1 hypothetical protein [Cellulomonas sp. PS-H5]
MTPIDITEAEAALGRAVAEADATFAEWVALEADAFGVWALDQAKKFVTLQHTHSSELGADGIARFRSAVERCVVALQEALPAAYGEGRPRNFTEVRSPARTDAPALVADFRTEFVAPLGEVVEGAGYDIDRWGAFSWYVGERRESSVRGKLYFDGGQGDATRALRVYTTAAARVRTARANVARVREQNARHAAAALWGND